MDNFTHRKRLTYYYITILIQESEKTIKWKAENSILYLLLVVKSRFWWYNKKQTKEISVCEVFDLKVSYKKLWVMLAEREMTNAELRKLAGIAPATFTKLRKNQEVALSVLMKIAEVLDCDAGDIVSFIKEETASIEKWNDKDDSKE